MRWVPAQPSALKIVTPLPDESSGGQLPARNYSTTRKPGAVHSNRISESG